MQSDSPPLLTWLPRLTHAHQHLLNLLMQPHEHIHIHRHASDELAVNRFQHRPSILRCIREKMVSAERKWCQEPLFTRPFLRRPRPRIVAPKFHCVTICSTQRSLPNGWPLLTLRLSASICSRNSSVFTHSPQSSGFAIGHSCSRTLGAVPALLHHHCSARSTSPARTGLRSTYRQTVNKYSLVSTGNDLNRP